MTASSAARGTLWSALDGTALFGRHAHIYRPRQPATPTVWIDDVETSRGDEVTIILPVFVVVDGDDQAQAAALDTWGDAVEDAAYIAGYRSAGRAPTILDVGGPSLRAVVVRVEVDHVGPTLCPTAPFTP
jgi:hypothetical protein